MSLEKKTYNVNEHKECNYMHIPTINLVQWDAHTDIIPIIALSSSFSSRFNKISTKFIVVESSTILFPFRYSMKIFERQVSISFLKSLHCLSSPCKSNGSKNGMRSLMLGLLNSPATFEMELKNSTIFFPRKPSNFSQRFPNNIRQMLLVVSWRRIGLTSTSFPSWECVMMLSTIYATSSWRPSSKLLSLSFVRSFVVQILRSRRQRSPYGVKIMSFQSKLICLAPIDKGLDAKSTSWFFNTSMAISAFEITIWFKHPKRKYIIGPYFCASSSKEQWRGLLK